MFDYWCPDDGNYVLLETLEGGNGSLLEGRCALCGKDISMTYKDWKEQDKQGIDG